MSDGNVETLTKAWVDFSKLKSGEGAWKTYWTPTMGADSNSTWNRLQQEWIKLLPSSPADVSGADLTTDQLHHLREMWVVRALITGTMQACIEIAYVAGRKTLMSGGEFFTWDTAGLGIKISGLTVERGRLDVKVNGQLVVRWRYEWDDYNSDDSKRGIYADVGMRVAISNAQNKAMADLYVPGEWEGVMLEAYGEIAAKIEDETTAEQRKERDDLLKELQLERRQDE